MNYQLKLSQIESYVYQLFKEDVSGHDYFHMKRVAKMAKKLAEDENADAFIAEAAGWLHDVGDKKLFTDPKRAITNMKEFFAEINLSDTQIFKIECAMKGVSYSEGNNAIILEGQVVQDADRLDAIGAIGIARTFAYGGVKGNSIFTEKKKNLDTTTIQHFYDKLLLLKDLMNTSSAKSIAIDRHNILETFLQQFYDEWNLKP